MQFLDHICSRIAEGNLRSHDDSIAPLQISGDARLHKRRSV